MFQLVLKKFGGSRTVLVLYMTNIFESNPQKRLEPITITVKFSIVSFFCRSVTAVTVLLYSILGNIGVTMIVESLLIQN